MASWEKDKFSDHVLSDASPVDGGHDIEKMEVNNESIVPVIKVQSSSRYSAIDPFGTPPDGGLNAWLKVFGCFLLYSNIW